MLDAVIHNGVTPMEAERHGIEQSYSNTAFGDALRQAA
jgi:hypothetical protein